MHAVAVGEATYKRSCARTCPPPHHREQQGYLAAVARQNGGVPRKRRKEKLRRARKRGGADQDDTRRTKCNRSQLWRLEKNKKHVRYLFLYGQENTVELLLRNQEHVAETFVLELGNTGRSRAGKDEGCQGAPCEWGPAGGTQMLCRWANPGTSSCMQMALKRQFKGGTLDWSRGCGAREHHRCYFCCHYRSSHDFDLWRL